MVCGIQLGSGFHNTLQTVFRTGRAGKTMAAARISSASKSLRSSVKSLPCAAYNFTLRACSLSLPTTAQSLQMTIDTHAIAPFQYQAPLQLSLAIPASWWFTKSLPVNIGKCAAGLIVAFTDDQQRPHRSNRQSDLHVGFMKACSPSAISSNLNQLLQPQPTQPARQTSHKR